MADFQTHEHDVLVIGAGGAGLRAAIEAATGIRVRHLPVDAGYLLAELCAQDETSSCGGNSTERDIRRHNCCNDYAEIGSKTHGQDNGKHEC